jgi:hypothetical protein
MAFLFLSTDAVIDGFCRSSSVANSLMPNKSLEADFSYSFALVPTLRALKEIMEELVVSQFGGADILVFCIYRADRNVCSTKLRHLRRAMKVS